MWKYLLFLVLLLPLACSDDSAPTEPVEPDVQDTVPEEVVIDNLWLDSTARIIKTAEYNRNTSELGAYLSHVEPSYRSAAALGFASFKDSNTVHLLAPLATDKHPKVQMAAAYALGQLKQPEAFPILKKAYYHENATPDAKQYILEAIGKTNHVESLPFLTGLDSITDPTEQTGRAWGIYRAMLYDNVSKKGTAIMVKGLSDGSATHQLVAAHYLARSHTNYDTLTNAFLDVFDADLEPEVMMAIARAMGTVDVEQYPRAKKIMLQLLDGKKDGRVTVNAISACYNWKVDEVHSAIEDLLESTDVQVAVKASEYMVNKVPLKAEKYVLHAQEAGHWRVKANLYRAALKKEPKHEWIEEVKRKFGASKNPYEKGALLVALSDCPIEMKFLGHQTLDAGSPIVRSSAMMALVNMRYSSAFSEAQAAHLKKGYGMNYEHGFNIILKECLSTDDPAVVAQAAALVYGSDLDFNTVFADEVSFMEERLEQLTLPEELETYIELSKAIAYVKGESFKSPEISYQPLDWDLIATIPSTQQVKITTSKGEVIVQLYVDDAPGSVSSFVRLIKSGFYNGKTIHRMVPNFVIQDGCPRGDGWGSPDFTLRSEFAPLRYNTGTLGMASAGPDTESSQWFITHSPTPHLDGSYTIFGQVVEGMDVIQTLGVGDTIETMTLLEM